MVNTLKIIFEGLRTRKFGNSVDERLMVNTLKIIFEGLRTRKFGNSVGEPKSLIGPCLSPRCSKGGCGD
jgi:hypothetical protein